MERFVILEVYDVIPFSVLKELMNGVTFLQIQFNLQNVLFYSYWNVSEDKFTLRFSGEIDPARRSNYIDRATVYWHEKNLLNPELEKWIIE